MRTSQQTLRDLAGFTGVPPIRGSCFAKPLDLGREDAGVWGAGDGPRWMGGCDLLGAFLGPEGGDLVAVELGEVVTHRD
jgi:hypothetical protein